MTTALGTDWHSQFGVNGWKPPIFIESKEALDALGSSIPQVHALRRAFETMHLDGIVCFDGAPAIYFKEVSKIDWSEVRQLRRQFWSQGLAPILVVIDPLNVHIYSSLARPLTDTSAAEQPESLVDILNRITAAAEIRQLVLSVGSGDFFRTHIRSFKPKQRVDRELFRNLQATREALAHAPKDSARSQMLDALLCRLVFTCYLFDRGAIDRGYLESINITQAEHLRDILARPTKAEARDQLYHLFKNLGDDFNGDLFSDDLDAEAAQVTDPDLDVLSRFFRASDVKTGQGALWPYDFGVIPIETISAIYEQFLKSADPEAKKTAGAFYTPRFLVEVILDIALDGKKDLLDCRFMDPSCGSGIFLVGLFNRMAQEWKTANPSANYDRLATALLNILRRNLFGVDESPTACRIAAFSLYLAVLDQLEPPAIRELQRKKKFLPRLVIRSGEQAEEGTRTIFCTDFFKSQLKIPVGFDFVVGNPPWKSEKSKRAPSVRWCMERYLPIPDKQAAVAFVWKAPEHVTADGVVCYVLPHGVLFNHGTTAIKFQKAWLSRHRVETVLNLADYQRFLFEDAENPAVVVRYRKAKPSNGRAKVHYLTPKTDWSVAQAEMISIYPQDQTWFEVRDVLADLKNDEVPYVWKERFWGTPRDWKFLDRLRAFEKLGEIVGSSKAYGKQWVVAQGFQEPGAADSPEDRKDLKLPTARVIDPKSPHFELFLLEADCDQLPSTTVTVRTKSNTNTKVYLGPHVMLTDGYKVAYADFDVAFRQGVRGIHGPKEDTDLLVFLSVYLNSPIALYYLFHTSGNLGVERAKVESGDAIRLPFPFPEDAPAGKEAPEIVSRVGELFREAVRRAEDNPADRGSLVKSTLKKMHELIFRYLDVDDNERILIEDTNGILIRSIRRKKASEKIPTLQVINPARREQYTKVLCNTLNEWARGGPWEIVGSSYIGGTSGLGLVALHRVKKGGKLPPQATQAHDIIDTLGRLQRLHRKSFGSIELIRGIKVFEGSSIFIIKPLSQRFWTRTTALNDADEIAAAILSRPMREKV